MKQSGEASVEEILESIKKVIAKDNREVAADQKRQLPKLERPAVPLNSKLPAHEASAVVPTAEDDVLDLGAAAEYLDEPADADALEAPLVTDQARSSMRESLAALAVLAEPAAAPQIVRSGETSLEGLARDLLRPALAEWLDKNLPTMVEEMVAAEIAKIVSKKG